METTKANNAVYKNSTESVPENVQKAFWIWLLAVAAGVVETIFQITNSLQNDSSSAESLLQGVIIRAIIYTIVVLIMIQMKKGKKWAKIALAIGLGVVGTFSLIIEPIRWFVEGHSISEAFQGVDFFFIMIIICRTIHIAAVFIALVFMLQSSSNSYFR